MYGIFETKDLTEKQNQKYLKSEHQITKKPTDNHKCKYGRNDIIEKIIKNCRGVKKCNDGVNRTKYNNERENFRSILGFKENDVDESKESSVLKSIMDVFEEENMETQYSVLKYKIDLYFHEY